MDDAVTQVAPRRTWRRLAWATAAFVFLPYVPHLRVTLPIDRTVLLLVPALAVCALLGWRNGGRAGHAVVWAALAVWVAAPGEGSYDWMARGWALLLGAVFGVVSLLNPAQYFFSRALASVAVAMVLAFTLASGGNGTSRVAGVMETELDRRNAEWIARMERERTSGAKNLPTSSPQFQAMAQETSAQLLAIPKYTGKLMPALLALESLAALALAWAISQRTGTAIGPQLGRLKEFRFNDQLVWGVAVALTILLLPRFSEVRSAGLNLLLFFGGLYVLRGLGVLAWMTKGRAMTLVLIATGVFAWPLLAAMAFALGLGDTWLDWRNRPKPGAA